MYVCICNAITDREVRAAVKDGAAAADEVFRSLGVEVRCGRCVDAVRNMMGDAGRRGERRHVTDAPPSKPRARCAGCTR